MANGDFWDTEKEVASIPKNGRGEEVKIKNVTKSGKNFVDVRTFYLGKGDVLLPGKGISIPAELAAEVSQAIVTALE
jgi:hypothetical protein